jgi:DNA polymerase III delta prime subunit
MKKRIGETLWTEAYRPQCVEDCILPKELKNNFQQIVKSGDMPNMLLCGGAGTGKTTVAKALCSEMGCDWIFINGSDENGIDVLRNKIKQFASSMSLNGGTKVVIIDESDYLTNNVQAALRAFMEEFSNNCRFILTCNFKNRVIEPLHSRCAVIEFNFNKKVLAQLASRFMVRLKAILEIEDVRADDVVLAQLIMKHAPDWRRVIGECQRQSLGGEIGAHALTDGNEGEFESLREALKTKNFKTMREWVAVHGNNGDSAFVFRKIYDSMDSWMEPSCKPAAVLILAEYQYKAAFVADREINLVAACTELMSNINWK